VTAAERVNILMWVGEAIATGARQSRACTLIGLSGKTLQRWREPNNQEDGRINKLESPKNKFSELERQRIISTANQDEYAHLPPSKLVPTLADKGLYIGSESTFYRVLKAHGLLTHRERSMPTNPRKKPEALTATGPNQIYTWDITYLPTGVRGRFFYLYLVLDIYSRKIVGWQVHDEERSALAADLMRDICLRERIDRNQVTLHSDNGSPMKGATMLATLEELGVVPSFSRPSVSNDNPYSEAMFRTLKYCPNYPDKPFLTLAMARAWVDEFTSWYNTEHLHSGIKFVTPEQRHKGEDAAILARRVEVYQRAKEKNPGRWSAEIRNWECVGEVLLNPERCKSTSKQSEAA